MGEKAAAVCADGACHYAGGIHCRSDFYSWHENQTLGLLGTMGKYSGDYLSAVFFLLGDSQCNLLFFDSSAHSQRTALACGKSGAFCIGFFYGVFVLDLAYSTHFMVKIRAFAAESGIVVLLEEFREDVHEAFRNHRKKPRFFFSMHTGKPLREILEQYRSTHFTSENRSWKRILPQKKKK